MENEHLKKGALVFQGFLSLFPAYAGVIPVGLSPVVMDKPFPRIRGGDPITGFGLLRSTSFSPHTRG